MWKATNTTKRDFRWPVVGAAYTSTALTDLGGGVFQGNVPTPPAGYTAYFIEATIDNELGLPIKVSTGIYLKGNPPTNNQPVLLPISDVILPEGSPLLINNSASDIDLGQTLTYSFYNYPYAIPPQVSIVPSTGVLTGTWTDQTAGQVPITVQVWDNGPTPLPDRKTFRVTVVNVAPVASLTGPGTALPSQSYAFTLLATDPSSVDQAAGFTFKIDWNGDGIDDQTVVGLSGTSVNHSFPSGNFNVRVTATDKDAGTSAVSTHAISVALPNQAPIDPLNQVPLSIDEGDSLLLEALGWTDPNNDPLTYTWDVDNDGQFDDATGASTTLNWSTLTALGLGDGDSVHTVRLRVDDGLGGVTTSGPILLTIHNVAPTSDAGTGYEIAEGLGLSLLGSGSDPAGANDPLTLQLGCERRSGVWRCHRRGCQLELVAVAGAGHHRGRHIQCPLAGQRRRWRSDHVGAGHAQRGQCRAGGQR